MSELPPPIKPIRDHGTVVYVQDREMGNVQRFDQGSLTVTLLSSGRPMVTAVDEQKFSRLANQWREGTRALSSDTDIVTDFAYQQIIGMGVRALPLIFDEMQAYGGRWFWALRAITGENPVRQEDRGNVRRMTETWLDWARERNYV